MKYFRRRWLPGASIVIVLSVVAAMLAAGVGVRSSDKASGGPVIAATPRVALLDAPVRIVVRGLDPHQSAVLKASTVDGSGIRWTSSAAFRADAAGSIDVAKAPSRSGTYRGRHGMGLFWSMRPAKADVQYFLPGGKASVRLQLVVQGRGVATSDVTRLPAAPTLVESETSVSRQGFVGNFSHLRPSRRRPGVMVLGGSEGGLGRSLLARLLASHGYPTLELAYFRAPGLPRELKRIPLEYFERALRWLATQRSVDGSRLIVVGRSRGGEVALLLASRYPQLIRGVAALAPSSVVNPSVDGGFPAWTAGGAPVPHVDADEFGLVSSTKHPNAVIPVERIAGPVFLVAGGMDELWPSDFYVRAIGDRMRAHGRGKDVTALTYRSAGHSVTVAVPYLPAPSTSVGFASPAANATALSDSWPKLLSFLRELSS